MKKVRFILGLLLILAFIAGCATIDSQQDGTASVRQLDQAKITAVKAKFAHDKVLAGVSSVEIKVINRECTLEGSVPNEEVKQNAEKLAASVEGVDKVVNKLQVKPELPVNKK